MSTHNHIDMMVIAYINRLKERCLNDEGGPNGCFVVFLLLVSYFIFRVVVEFSPTSELHPSRRFLLVKNETVGHLSGRRRLES